MHLSPSTFDGLRRAVYRACGLVLGDDKAYLIRDRLLPVIRSSGLTGYEQPLERIQSLGDERLVSSVIDAITTQETSFLRDRHVFDALSHTVLPRLIETCIQQNSTLRILSAGTATGQEAYSLAMLVSEALSVVGPDRRHSLRTVIIGIDVSPHALRIAEAGAYYPREIEKNLTVSQLQRHFELRNSKYCVRPPIRNMVEFRRVNLAKPFANLLGSFSLICCRNVMIYFDEATRASICEQFHRMLANDGWLLLGSAENLIGMSPHFASTPLGGGIIYRTRERTEGPPKPLSPMGGEPIRPSSWNS